MIYLFTGLPGSGKTTLAVSKLVSLGESRPVFFSGIKLTKDAPEWWSELDGHWTNAPDGSIVVIDEAQRVFRPMSSNAGVPEHIAALETHRHRGIDLILITQHPMLLHNNVRNLVGSHEHIIRDKFGRYLKLYWPEVGDPRSSTSRGAAKAEKYKLDSSVHKYYESTKFVNPDERKFSRKLFFAKVAIGLLILSLFIVPYAAYNAFVSSAESVDDNASSASAVASNLAASAVGAVPVVQVKAASSPEEVYAYELERSLKITREHNDYLRESYKAAVFNDARSVPPTDFPRIKARVISGSKCAVYDQLGVVIPMSDKECRLLKFPYHYPQDYGRSGPADSEIVDKQSGVTTIKSSGAAAATLFSGNPPLPRSEGTVK